MKMHVPLLALGMFMAANVFAGGGKPIAFASAVNPTFGDLLGGASGRNFILGTTGAISGADAGDYIAGAAAGSVLITGAANKNIDILATNFIANGGVTIANVTCNYDATGDADCDVGFTGGPPDVGKTLMIGLEINTTQVHGDNATASPTFDIVVNYP